MIESFILKANTDANFAVTFSKVLFVSSYLFNLS